MDSFWKSFSIGFLLRSAFSGYLSLMSFFFLVEPYKIFDFKETNNLKLFLQSWPLLLILSMFIGTTINGIHRAVIYPFIESIKDSGFANRLRNKYHLSLISNNSADFMINYWKIKKSEKTTEWGDSTHLQYISGLSLIFGSFVAAGVVREKHMKIEKMQDTFLLFCLLGLLFYFSGLISDWRLKFVRDKMLSDKEKILFCNNQGESSDL